MIIFTSTKLEDFETASNQLVSLSSPQPRSVVIASEAKQSP